MRNMNEIKAEVFARSEKRIKKRKRIISIVLSLCICILAGITALSFISPPVSTDNYYNNSNSDGLFEDMEGEAVNEEIIKVKYGKKEFTSKAKIKEITCIVQSIRDASSDDSETDFKNQSATDATLDLYTEGVNKLYIITASGYEEYIIGTNALTNTLTGYSYVLSEEKRNALLNALE